MMSADLSQKKFKILMRTWVREQPNSVQRCQFFAQNVNDADGGTWAKKNIFIKRETTQRLPFPSIRLNAHMSASEIKLRCVLSTRHLIG